MSDYDTLYSALGLGLAELNVGPTTGDALAQNPTTDFSNPYYTFDATDARIQAENIIPFRSDVYLIGYNPENPKGLPFVGSMGTAGVNASSHTGPGGGTSFNALMMRMSDFVLGTFEVLGNNSILLGCNINTVYTLGTEHKYTRTFYAIGGTGGPFIGINNFNTNGSDPLGELWKCSESGHGKVEVISYDGVHYCMPRAMIAFDYVFGKYIDFTVPGIVHPYMYADSFTASTTRELYERFADDEGISLEDSHRTIESRSEDMYGDLFLDDGPHYGLLTSKHLFDKAFDLSDTEPIHVPWPSSVINDWTGDPTGGPRLVLPEEIVGNSAQVLALTEKFFELVSEYEDLASYGGLIDTHVPTMMRPYQQSRLIEEYAADNAIREGDFQVQYSVPEAQRLVFLFGSFMDNANLLNNIFMGTAQYLATTYLESVYTFKTVKMPPLIPTIMSPPSLSDAMSTVKQQNYDVSSTPFSPSAYYTVPYGVSEGFVSPAAPGTGAFTTGATSWFGDADSPADAARAEMEEAREGLTIGEYDASYSVDRTVGTTPGGTY